MHSDDWLYTIVYQLAVVVYVCIATATGIELVDFMTESQLDML